MKVKRRKYTPPEADLIRPAITGNIVALFDVRAHYDRLMRYKLNKEIMALSEAIGFSPDMFDFDNLLGDVGVILDNAVMTFKE